MLAAVMRCHSLVANVPLETWLLVGVASVIAGVAAKPSSGCISCLGAGARNGSMTSEVRDQIVLRIR